MDNRSKYSKAEDKSITMKIHVKADVVLIKVQKFNNYEMLALVTK